MSIYYIKLQCPFVCVCMYVCLSVFLYVCLFVCLSVCIPPFRHDRRTATKFGMHLQIDLGMIRT